MKTKIKTGMKNDGINVYIEDQEYIANTYVMRCFTITMILYLLTYILNILGVFIIDKAIMQKGFVTSVIIFIVITLISKRVSLSDKRVKYCILFGVVLVFTVMGVTITYHVVLVSLLPFLYATLYSSKRVMRYTYILTVISTVFVVYGGYYFGLCDANMVLLTTKNVQDYILGGHFTLTEINPNPIFNLMLFFVVPRCLIYISFASVCSSIFKIVSGSLEKARLTAELEKAKEEAEQANRAKSDFLAKISHEVRTPVNAVIGMNEMILRESSQKDVREYAKDVKASSIALLNIVNELLDSSKIESGMLEIIEDKYDIAPIFNDLFNMVNIKAQENYLNLVFDIDPTIPCEYCGDDKRIRQILLNLLTNAVKYTDTGTVTLKTTCTIEGEQATLHFAVKDTGIGIRQEDIKKLAAAFQRLDLTRNKNVEGTGLGLNIVQQFLSLMGSELQIHSVYGEGSEFAFDLVQKIENMQPLGDFRERVHRQEEQKCDIDKFTAPDAKILVVDDFEINRKVFKALLKYTQAQITDLESGEECIALLKKQNFDLIFLDHMMPGMDGIETMHEIKKQNLCEGVPIIMLTANTIVGDREKYIGEGFDDFLSKPIISDKLDEMLWNYLPDRCIVRKESDKKMVGIDELKKALPEIDYKVGLMTSSGNEEFYMELFNDFTELPIKDELERNMAKSDYKNYNIRIHGFKNSADFIGAKELSELADEIEKLTKEGIPSQIIPMQNELLEKYSWICKQYHDVVGGHESRE